MRKLVFLAVAVMVGLGATASASTAAPTAHHNREVSGPFTGTSVFDFAASRCSFAHQVYDGTYSTKKKASGSFHLDGCVMESGAAGFSYTGTFVLITPDRATLSGTVTGLVGGAASTSPCVNATDIPVALDFMLATTRGTKKLEHVVGSIHLTGTWCSPARPDTPGAISGTLAGALTRGHSPK